VGFSDCSGLASKPVGASLSLFGGCAVIGLQARAHGESAHDLVGMVDDQGDVALARVVGGAASRQFGSHGACYLNRDFAVASAVPKMSGCVMSRSGNPLRRSSPQPAQSAAA
jgi:hypothetical protein